MSHIFTITKFLLTYAHLYFVLILVYLLQLGESFNWGRVAQALYFNQKVTGSNLSGRSAGLINQTLLRGPGNLLVDHQIKCYGS